MLSRLLRHTVIAAMGAAILPWLNLAVIRCGCDHDWIVCALMPWFCYSR